MGKGIFGDLFDLNGDGKLDSIERAADYLEFRKNIDSLEEDDDFTSDENEDNGDGDLFSDSDFDSDGSDF